MNNNINIENVLESIDYFLKSKEKIFETKKLALEYPDQLTEEISNRILLTDQNLQELEKRYLQIAFDYPIHKDVIYKKLGISIQ